MNSPKDGRGVDLRRVKDGLGGASYIIGSKDSDHSGPAYFYSELRGEALCKRLGPLFHRCDIVSGCRGGVDHGGLIRLGERTSAIAGVENEVRNDGTVGNVVNLDALVRMEDHRRWYAVLSLRPASKRPVGSWREVDRIRAPESGNARKWRFPVIYYSSPQPKIYSTSICLQSSMINCRRNLEGQN